MGPKPEIVEMVHELDFNPHQNAAYHLARLTLLEAKARLADCYIALEDAQRDVKLAEAHVKDVCMGVANAAQQIGTWEPREDAKGLRRSKNAGNVG